MDDNDTSYADRAENNGTDKTASQSPLPRRTVLKGALTMPLVAGGVTSASGWGSAQQSSDEDWPQFQFDAVNSGHNPNGTGPTTGIASQWTFGDPTGALGSPVVADGTVYVGSNENHLYAVDATDGSLVWQFTASGDVRPPAVDQDQNVVFVGSKGDGTVHALDADTGDQLAQQNVGDSQSDPVVLTNNTLFTGGGNAPGQGDAIVAVDIDYTSSGVQLSERWREQTGECFGGGTSAAVAGGVVYITEDCGKTWALDASDGDVQWTFDDGSGDGQGSTPAVADGIVYFGTNEVGAEGNTLFALDAATGSEQWRFTISPVGEVSASPAVADGTVFFGSNNSNVYALNASDGTEAWDDPFSTGGAISSAPAVVNGVVYVASRDGHLYLLDATTGDEIDRISTGGVVGSSPAVANGNVYVGSNDSNLYCLANESDEGDAMYELTAEAESEVTAPGETDTISVRVENTGSTTGDPVVLFQPATGTTDHNADYFGEDFNVVTHEDDGGEWVFEGWSWTDVDPGETREPSVKLVAADSLDPGEYTFALEVYDDNFNDEPEDRATATITIGIIADALSEYREAVTDRIHAEIDAWARFEADAIREHGDEYTAGLRDYWGYRAGEVSEQEVPSDLTAITETLTNELESSGLIDEGDMGMSPFLEELYNVVDTVDPDPALISEYYMGTAAGQSNHLRVNGQTIAERIDDLQTGIEDYQSTLMTVLSDDQFTQTDVQRIAEVIRDHTDQIRREQESVETSVADLREVLIGADDVDGQFFVEDLQTGDTDDVSPNLAGVGFFAGGIYLAGKAAVGWAASHGTGLAIGTIGAGAVGLAGSGYLGGSASAGSGLSGVSSQQLLQQQMARSTLRWHAADDLSEQAAEELTNEVINTLRELATETEITDLTLPDMTEEDKVELSLWERIINILPFVGEETTTVGRKTGTLTIENTGSHPINAPTAGVKTKIYSQKANEFVNSGYHADFSELAAVAPIDPGETVEVEFEYEVPYEQFGSAFRMSIDLYEAVEYDVSTVYAPNLSPDPLASTSGTFTAGETGESLSTDNIAEDVISNGESRTFPFSPDEDSDQFIIDVEWDDPFVDLHLYDESGNHTGYNYEDTTVDQEISGSGYSGRSTDADGFEWIAVSDVESTNYEIELVAPGDSSQDSVRSNSVEKTRDNSTAAIGYNLSKTTAPELPANLVVPFESLRLKAPAGESVERDLRFHEGDGDHALRELTVTPTELVHEEGAARIRPEQISFSTNGVDVAAGESMATTLTVSIDATLPTGAYAGRLDIETQTETDSVDLTIVVEEEEGPPPIVGDNPPRDLNGDGLYRDIDGDGEFSIQDVQVFFQNRNSDAVQNNPEYFNFDGEDPADVTIRDVQALFQDFVGER